MVAYFQIPTFRSIPYCEAVCRRHRLEGSDGIVKEFSGPRCDFNGQCPRDRIPFTTIQFVAMERSAARTPGGIPNAACIFQHHDVMDMTVLILHRPMAANWALKLRRG